LYQGIDHFMVQNGYTAVHSAVFHGRCCDTIRLLLNVDEVHRKRNYDRELYVSNNNNDNNKGNNTKMNTEKIMTQVLPATMQANKFGELPLHFAAMRGECTRSIALLSQAAPWEV
jgi:ankyrin repeat protein